MSLVLSQTQEVHEEIDLLLDRLRRVSREQAKAGLPALKPRPRTEGEAGRARGFGGAGGMGGGMMGGMGGGMGAFGGAQVNPVRGSASAAPAAAQQTDLLQGVRGINKSNQGKQSESLQKMYDSGKGKKGVGAGGAF